MLIFFYPIDPYDIWILGHISQKLSQKSQKLRVVHKFRATENSLKTYQSQSENPKCPRGLCIVKEGAIWCIFIGMPL